MLFPIVRLSVSTHASVTSSVSVVCFTFKSPSKTACLHLSQRVDWWTKPTTARVSRVSPGRNMCLCLCRGQEGDAAAATWKTPAHSLECHTSKGLNHHQHLTSLWVCHIVFSIETKDEGSGKKCTNAPHSWQSHWLPTGGGGAPETDEVSNWRMSLKQLWERVRSLSQSTELSPSFCFG